MDQPGKTLELGDRPDPVWAKAVHVGRPANDAIDRVRDGPETLICRYRDYRPGAHLSHCRERVLLHRLLNEIDVVLPEHGEMLDRLRHCPRGVRVQPEPGRGPEG